MNILKRDPCSPCTATDYRHAIAAAGAARVLHALNDCIQADDSLDGVAQQELSESISRRFGALNAAALGPQKPRWGQSRPAQLGETHE